MPTSVIVIAFNEQANITDCLTSITGQSLQNEISEIIVVDDHSTDSTCEKVNEYKAMEPRITLISHSFNRGRGAARATGLAASKASYVAFVDGDIRLPKDWLERCIEVLDDTTYAAVGGIAVPDGDIAWVYNNFHLPARPHPHTTTVTGNNGLYRTAAAKSIGFDANLRDGEDIAFNEDARRKGYELTSLPDLIVEHCESKTYAESLLWTYTSGRGATRQLLRYRRLRRPDIASGIFLMSALFLRNRPRAAAASAVLQCTAAAYLHLKAGLKVSPKSARSLAATFSYTPMILMYHLGRTHASVEIPARGLYRAVRARRVRASLTAP